jgi:hypothetical protein
MCHKALTDATYASAFSRVSKPEIFFVIFSFSTKHKVERKCLKSLL